MTPPGEAADDGRAALAGRKGWVISDGRAGNEVQSRGVFDALGIEYRVLPAAPKGIWRLLGARGPVNPAEGFGRSGSPYHPPWPDFAIATGRLTTPYIRKLKQVAGMSTYTIILLDPKVSTKSADLFWVPEHDSLRGANVVSTLTSPHSFSQRRLAQLRARAPDDIADLPQPRVAVMLGGPNGDYRYTATAIERLSRSLQSLAALGAGLMITPSRRTPVEVTEAVAHAARGAAARIWDGVGENPYPSFLAHADALIVPADSVNMTGEACATGRPVYVFQPEGGSPKFSRFHAALTQYGATKPLPARFDRLETWSYQPLNSAEQIAMEITRRWLQRRRMLGSRG
jgi:mitochondrial fission protein ELM1